MLCVLSVNERLAVTMLFTAWHWLGYTRRATAPDMRIGVNKEHATGERRVAVTPDSVSRLVKAGHAVVVQGGAGDEAGYGDAEYEGSGATIAFGVGDVTHSVDVLVKVGAPSEYEVGAMEDGSAVIGMLDARRNSDLLAHLAETQLTAFAMELVPRIARAQSMDVLSSQASLAGYKAVLIAADSIGKFFPMMMTAAGTIPPAQVLVLGAGVAGLQAVATAKRLGAAVSAFDVRAVVAEQVESLGAKFIAPPAADDAESAGGYARAQTADENVAQQEFLAEHVARSDVVITTAAIPGRQAPVLVTSEMLAGMKAGSVVVDLAAETGGNVEASVEGASVDVDGVIVHGPANVPSSMPYHASSLYGRNVVSIIGLLEGEDGAMNLDFDDEVIDAVCVTHAGEVRHSLGG